MHFVSVKRKINIENQKEFITALDKIIEFGGIWRGHGQSSSEYSEENMDYLTDTISQEQNDFIESVNLRKEETGVWITIRRTHLRPRKNISIARFNAIKPHVRLRIPINNFKSVILWPNKTS